MSCSDCLTSLSLSFFKIMIRIAFWAGPGVRRGRNELGKRSV
jgi:hypothetical protein